MKKVILTLSLVLAQNCFAAGESTTPTASIWKGQGSVFNPNGEIVSTYDLSVKNTKTGEKTESEITITLQDGTVMNLQCTNSAGNNDSWSSICTNGKGGGRCFGDGLCISYVENSTGNAYATNIALDGPSDMRLLRTELQKGKAVRFFKEKLHKQ